MPSLKLSNLFRRDPDRPSLKERAAATADRIRAFATAPSVDGEEAPTTLEEMATLDFAAYSLDTPTRDPNGWMEQFSHHAIGMHIADRTLRMSKDELVDFIQKGGERDADTPAIMFKALDAAQETFEGWGKLLSLARIRYMVAASSAVRDQESVTAEAAERAGR